jgi:hypothetical protein
MACSTCARRNAASHIEVAPGVFVPNPAYVSQMLLEAQQGPAASPIEQGLPYVGGFLAGVGLAFIASRALGTAR